jgi:hypothetical protein
MPWIAAAAAVGGSMLNRSSQKESASAQRSASDQAYRLQREMNNQARHQAMQLHQSAQQNALAGFQGGMDVLGQTIPAQLQALQGGNTNAQNTMRSGLDPQIAAILGGNIDLSGLQAQQAPIPDFSMFQRQVPEFQQIHEALNYSPDFTSVAEQFKPNIDMFGIEARMNQNPYIQQDQQLPSGMENPAQNIPFLGGSF